MKDFWNQRYQESAYSYGEKPNDYFKSKLDGLPKGSLLLPAEGEGRQAVYAKNQGFDVTAFDFSLEAKKKAIALAEKSHLELDYQVCDVLDFKSNKIYDVLGLIYAHFPFNIRKQAINKLLQFVKPNGFLIFEGFSENQINNNSGGPKDPSMLFTIDQIKSEFENIKFIELDEHEIILDEGLYHRGAASVIRFFAQKKFELNQITS